MAEQKMTRRPRKKARPAKATEPGPEQRDARDGPDQSAKAQTKIEKVLELLQRPEGATLDEMVEATGWVTNTTRASLSGLRKKGHAIIKTKRGDATCYSVSAES